MTVTHSDTAATTTVGSPVIAEAIRRAHQRLAVQGLPAAKSSHTSRPGHCTAP